MAAFVLGPVARPRSDRDRSGCAGFEPDVGRQRLGLGRSQDGRAERDEPDQDQQPACEAGDVAPADSCARHLSATSPAIGGVPPRPIAIVTRRL